MISLVRGWALCWWRCWWFVKREGVKSELESDWIREGVQKVPIWDLWWWIKGRPANRAWGFPPGPFSCRVCVELALVRVVVLPRVWQSQGARELMVYGWGGGLQWIPMGLKAVGEDRGQRTSGRDGRSCGLKDLTGSKDYVSLGSRGSEWKRL